MKPARLLCGVVVIALGACAGNPLQDVGLTGRAQATGTIASTQAGGSTLRLRLVSLSSTDWTPPDTLDVFVAATTEIRRQHADGSLTAASTADLVTGASVATDHTFPVRESQPPQADAIRVWLLPQP